MGKQTGIEWTDSTFNGWIGCTEVTPACDNCYARVLAERYGWAYWGDDNPRKLTADSNWRKPLGWDKQAKADGRMHKVFAFSLSDVFDVKVPEAWLTRFFGLMHQTTNTHWQVLTKRAAMPKRYAGQYPADKVWLGTSLGNDDDMPMARKIAEAPALLHWVSYEPAIGPLSVQDLPEAIKWLVIGGESGKNARPFRVEWAIDSIKEAKDFGVDVFMKQVGSNAYYRGSRLKLNDFHGKDMSEWPQALLNVAVREFPV